MLLVAFFYLVIFLWFVYKIAIQWIFIMLSKRFFELDSNDCS
ncbi:hypothetical protein VIBHAR_05321 [Vibrio campbellii ATCC BAA-1116]|uniref:Uncharacterized protein n=1 Tax=Vibrio campbellii (strain ATCC BAA-1116) TaxID=2902295 RepID=A7N7C4_VIBC1|nr:hypothetical protein VIBHAR_05321 [Vibrio campbellii ATCC BAA-1116]